MLAVAGPVTVDGIEINSGQRGQRAAERDVLRFPDDQAPADAFFAAASAAIFNKLVAGSWDPLLMMDAMRTSIAEQRVYGWFTREPEQAIARELGIDGAMKADNAETTEVGIFLNDHGVSKMEYYLSTSVAVDCNVEARTVTTSITMTNSVDRDDLTYTIRLAAGPDVRRAADLDAARRALFRAPGRDDRRRRPGARRRRRARARRAPRAAGARRASPCSSTAARRAPSRTRARCRRASSDRCRCATRPRATTTAVTIAPGVRGADRGSSAIAAVRRVGSPRSPG